MTAESSAALSQPVTYEELIKHNSTEDCWVVLHSKVYDVTSFLNEHPGGSAIILKFAGADATKAYDEIHAPGMVEETLEKEQFMGTIDLATIPQAEPDIEVVPNALDSVRPALHSLLSVHDFEDVARRAYSKKTYAFYSSAATDLISHHANLDCYKQLLLRPRILRNVKEVSIRRSILGCETSAPFFVSPVAMAKLAHPDGELAIARACGAQNIAYIVSNNASYPLTDIVKAARPGQPLFLQLYVNSERHKTTELLRKARDLGVRAVFVTVDAPIPGKREADERIAAGNLSSGTSGAVAVNDKKGGGLGRVMAKYIDSTLCWDDLEWIRETAGVPIILKGIQTAADAKKAVEYGAEGIMLSNHGGRSLDTVQPAIVTLLEIHKQCPEVLSKLEIYVDGGIRRGTDILKALALGATAVGIGRPCLYSLAYGQEGVEHLIEILKDELESTMKLAGITDVDQAHPGMVNTAHIEPLIRTTESHPWIQWQPRCKL
ncbi:hypothetical protein LTR10_022931 [Elasticomyces elasticus]|uniref:Cytochrome b2, mitochondrial n=1 Tax=Exophiala sideris TaxID=1016849 RepID=A0ABR0J694_9EURO|nr:hypothetical protein LTR10_022931 [Elasticomyces elasticus]KAK5028257.1 hypothetical protein LTS07_006348 [Exophiala sideris]KAK5036100.1 hypothetical protein LTR13_005670 [Exophiala sideris]KAK5057137.1 hypothetical protein LTR69_007775 [Exophiala sideris]KAK5181544.1 hypothetical protein LTR44_006339 [Eurotiomycetes sp. CCFEE 6388]